MGWRDVTELRSCCSWLVCSVRRCAKNNNREHTMVPRPRYLSSSEDLKVT